MTRRAGEEHGAGLDDPGGAARAVDRERRGMAVRKVPPQLHQGARAAARRGSPGGAVPEPADDAGDPLAVEVLTGDDDDAAVLPEEGGRQDAPVPEREDGLFA